MECKYCFFETGCRLRQLEPSLVSCTGPSRPRPGVELPELPEPAGFDIFEDDLNPWGKSPNLAMFMYGDRVRAVYTDPGDEVFRSDPMTVIGFVEESVQCMLDSGNVFFILPENLKKIKESEGATGDE